MKAELNDISETAGPGSNGGGMVYVIADQITFTGGASCTAAVSGRIAVYYENTFSGNFTPGYLQKQDTADTPFNADFADPQTSAQHQGEYGAVTHIVDGGKEFSQVLFVHRAGEPLRLLQRMPPGNDRAG